MAGGIDGAAGAGRVEGPGGDDLDRPDLAATVPDEAQGATGP